MACLFGGLKSSAQDNFWEPVRGPYGLSLSSIVQSPNGQLLAAGSIGVFRSTDGGETWKRDPLEAYVSAMFVTKKSSILLDVHGDPSLKSVDGGLSWKRVQGGEIEPICSDKSGNIYGIQTSLNWAIWRSSDDGDSWQRIDTKTPHPSFYSGISDFRGDIYVGGWRCFVKSTDNGITWKSLPKNQFGKNLPDVSSLASTKDSCLWAVGSDGLFTMAPTAHSWKKVRTNLPQGLPHKLLITQKGSMVLWGYFEGRFYQVFRSIDHGRTWINTFTSNAAHSITAMAVDSTGSIFLAGSIIHRSTDDGVTWSECSEGLTNDGMRSLAIGPRGTIFAGTFHGLFKSTDSAKNWMRIDSMLTGTYVWFSAILPFTDSIVFVVNGNEGLSISRDGGITWHQTEIRGDVNAIRRDKLGNIYLTRNGSLYVSADTGNTWKYRDFPDDAMNLTINSDDVILVGAGEWDGGAVMSSFHAYRGSRGPADWVNVNPTNSEDVQIIPSIGRMLFISSHGVWCSSDGGVNWLRADSTAPESFDNMVETGSGALYGSSEGTFVSTNGGISWQPINRGLITGRLGELQVYQIAIHPDGHLYVGTRHGLFKSVRRVE